MLSLFDLGGVPQDEQAIWQSQCQAGLFVCVNAASGIFQNVVVQQI